MTYQELFKLIGDFGLSLVISGIVVYGALQILNIYIDKLKNKQDEEHDDLLHIRRSVNIEIEGLLDRLLLKTQGSRTFIFEYHNGGANFSGIPFFKMSNTYEFCAEGVSSEIHNLTNLPCSLFTKLLELIEKKDYLLVDVEKRLKTIPNIAYETLVQQNITKTLFICLKDNADKPIGYIGIDYCVGQPDFEEKHIELLEEVAFKVGCLLSTKERRKR